MMNDELKSSLHRSLIRRSLHFINVDEVKASSYQFSVPRSSLLNYRVAPAAAVVGRLRVEPAVVVVEHYVLALVARDVRDAAEVALVLRDEERARLHREHHPRRIHVAALVVDAPGVLRRSYRNV